MNIPTVGEVWRHYKTSGNYEVVGLAKIQSKIESLDMQDCVIYRSLSDNKVWVRPLVDFIENVSTEEGVTVPRFVKVH